MRKKSRKGKKRNVSNVAKDREFQKSLRGQVSSVLGALGSYKKGHVFKSNSGRSIRHRCLTL